MLTTHRVIMICLASMPALMPRVCADAVPKDTMSWLDNGEIRLGADLNIGGSITWLADAKTGENLINSHDWGRQIQMSFYAGPVPFVPDGKEAAEGWKSLGWNPIQSGDCFGNRAKVLEHRNDGSTLYVKCIPLHWPLNNVPAQCTFECWYTLDGRTVQVRSRLNNLRDDHTQYPARMQELPAVYTNAPWHKLMTYTGRRPFTGAKLAEIPKQQHPEGGIVWANWFATENWAALVNEQNTGLGIWHPNVYTFIGGFYGTPGTGGPADIATGYMSPIRPEILDWNMQYDYQYVLIVDSLENIRKYVYANAAPPGKPDFQFTVDRRHWTCADAVAGSLPLSGALTVTPKSEKPIQLISPDFFCKAAPNHKLLLTIAADIPRPPESIHGRLYWKTFTQQAFAEENSLPFEWPTTAAFETFAVDIGSATGYKGVLTGLRIDFVCPAQSTLKLQRIRIE